MKNGIVAILLVVAIVLSGGAGYLIGANVSGIQTGKTTDTTVIGSYSPSFAVTVNYTGPWKLTYSGQTNVGESNPYNVTGTRTGTGFYSMYVTLSGLNNKILYLCAHAQKLDASNGTLVLMIDPAAAEISQPNGSTSTCGGVAP